MYAKLIVQFTGRGQKTWSSCYTWDQTDVSLNYCEYSYIVQTTNEKKTIATTSLQQYHDMISVCVCVGVNSR